MAETSMREGYGKALAEYGAVNPDVVVLDACGLAVEDIVFAAQRALARSSIAQN